MWDGFWRLLAFCVVMAVSSFLAGLLPISFSLSQSKFRIISALGSGLLIGTCLIVIIPEGIETTYSVMEHYYEHDRGAGSDYAGETYEPHGWIAVALIAGYILMFLIDRLPQHAAKHAPRGKPLHIPLANLSTSHHNGMSSHGPGREPAAALTTAFLSQGTAATIGLVIHAIADGVALAASTFIKHARTGVVVFFALMIHKAPAAFGLTAVLLNKGLSSSQARMHLVLFSLAAPVGAMATWTFVNLFRGPDLWESDTRFATGMLLIFSGGTFLYVAMHTAGNADEHQGHGRVMESGPSDDPEHAAEHTYRLDSQPPSFRDTALTVTGMLLPLLAELGHAH